MEKIDQIVDLIAYAKKHIPFYGNLYDEIDITEIKTWDDLKKLPMITANDLITHSNELKSTGERPYRVTSSSGTLGNPKIIYRNRKDTQISVKVLEEMLRMAGVTGKDTVLIGQPFDMAHFGYLVLGGCEKINAMSIPAGISMSNEKYMSLILDYRPSVICTSLSRMLAIIKLLKENLIESVPFVKNIILAGEPLNDAGIEKITEYFHTVPFNFYGSEETDGLASDCMEHAGLHFFDELYHMELLEIEGIKPQKEENRIGEIVLTSLYQKGVPLIRYRLGDIVEVEKEMCVCGSKKPLIHVYGRAMDSFTIFDGITIMNYQIEAVLNHFFKDIMNYQVVISSLLPGVEEILIKIERKNRVKDFDEYDLLDLLWNSSEDLQGLRETGQLKIKVSVNKGEISMTQRGKTRKIIDLRDK